MNHWKPVSKKASIWLGFNGGAQILPIFYLWLHRTDEPAAFWEYVNCTLAILIAVGMLFAVLSDLVTEKGRPMLGWVSVLIICFLLVAFLHRVVHDEILKSIKPDFELLVESLAVCVGIIVVSTLLKAGMWYDDAVAEHQHLYDN